MAVTFTNGNQQDRITVSGTIKTVTQVNLDDDTRTVLIQGFDSGGDIPTTCFVAISGTDNTDIGTDFFTIPAGAALRFDVSHGTSRTSGVPKTIYIGSSVASGIIEVWASKVVN